MQSCDCPPDCEGLVFSTSVDTRPIDVEEFCSEHLASTVKRFKESSEDSFYWRHGVTDTQDYSPEDVTNFQARAKRLLM